MDDSHSEQEIMNQKDKPPSLKGNHHHLFALSS